MQIHIETFLCLLVIALLSQVHAQCQVEIEQGSLRGAVMTSLHGRDFCSYRSIPFAKPPVGDLRFRDPQPPGPWTGELNATNEVKMCLQGVLSLYYGDEDCLYLNVNTPQVNAPSGALVPVLVFIHGGALVIGSGEISSYGPHYFLDEDVIMVTINYRLGIFGFLSTGDDAAAGNYGLKDQTEALRWIQKNIAYFGGDPNKVTIMGESAGAMSVHFHILSPLSSGLFHGGISESGAALMPLFFQNDPLPAAQEQAKAVGCPTDNNDDLVNCLRNLDVDVLMSTPVGNQSTSESNASPLLSLFNVMYRPVKEVRTDANPNPFLLDTPENIILSGNFNKVPYLLGTNANEGGLFFVFFIGTQAALDDLNANFDEIMKAVFFLSENAEEGEIEEIVNKVADFYLGTDHTVTPSNVHLFEQAGTDRFMQHNVQKAVELHLKAGHDNIYLYNFGYRGKYSILTPVKYGNITHDLGVLHVDELEYSLSSGLVTDKWEEGHPDLEVVDTVITLWTNFMKYGNPTPTEAEAPQGVKWVSAGADEGHINYYVFGHAEPPVEPIEGILPLKISLQPDKFKDRMDFWDSLNLIRK